MILPKVQRFSGFTLLEMLIVVAIMIILFAIGIASFGGMRDSILISQNYYNFSQDIRWAQKSSILLKREKNEYWPYGIGLDLRNVSVDGTYKFVKWCSPFADFDPNGSVLMNSELPNYDPSLDLNTPIGANVINGYIPTTVSTCSICGAGACSNTLIEVKGRISTQFEKNLTVRLVSTGSNVGFVFFESVTGRAFLYSKTGQLLNYTSTGGKLDYNLTSILDVQLEPKSGNLGLARRLNMQPVSGRISEITTMVDAAGTGGDADAKGDTGAKDAGGDTGKDTGGDTGVDIGGGTGKDIGGDTGGGVDLGGDAKK